MTATTTVILLGATDLDDHALPRQRYHRHSHFSFARNKRRHRHCLLEILGDPHPVGVEEDTLVHGEDDAVPVLDGPHVKEEVRSGLFGHGLDEPHDDVAHFVDHPPQHARGGVRRSLVDGQLIALYTKDTYLPHKKK